MTARCWRCGHAIDADDRYCRACGEGQGRALAWYYRPVWIALLALTALGPFALIPIWRTPALGPTAKWIASIVLVAFTVWISWQLWIDVHTLLDV
jgi:hypothetical protein